MKKFEIVKTYLQQMRIKSWLKNVFVFFPIVFSLELFQWDKLGKAIILAFSFCLISSSIYVLNDICDMENDRKHNVKKNRPIASGKISIPKAWLLFAILLSIGLSMTFLINVLSLELSLTYLLINILYSKGLKKQPVLDCFCISAGFLLRVLVGGTIVNDGVSNWMFLTVLSLSLFMAFGKRQGELHLYESRETRDVLGSYESTFINGSVFICAGLTIVFYSLWVISQRTSLVYTIPVVLFIILRYLLLVFMGRGEADPTTLILSDKTLFISCGLCAVIMIALLYGGSVLQ